MLPIGIATHDPDYWRSRLVPRLQGIDPIVVPDDPSYFYELIALHGYGVSIIDLNYSERTPRDWLQTVHHSTGSRFLIISSRTIRDIRWPQRVKLIRLNTADNDDEVIEQLNFSLGKWTARKHINSLSPIKRRMLHSHIWEALPGAIAVFNRNCHLVYASRKFSELTNTPLQLLPYKTSREICEQLACCEEHCLVERMFESNQQVKQTATISLNGYDTRHFELTASPAGDASAPYAVLHLRDITEWRQLTSELEQVRHRQDRRIHELSRLGDIRRALHSAKEWEQVLYMILIAVTSDLGLGFNRAFFLLMDATTGELKGQLAVGPDSSEDASRIWQDLEHKHLSLQDLFADWKELFKADTHVNHIALEICLSPNRDDSAISQAISQRRPLIIERNHQDLEFWDLLATNECAIVPLISDERLEGALLVDNAITRQPLQAEQLEQLARFADMAATAVQHGRWNRTLETQLKLVKDAFTAERAERERAIRNERLIALGELSVRVAHEIRNPLAAIGGFAATLLEDTPANTMSALILTQIVSEVRRLESILNETLSYTNQAPPQFQHSTLREAVEHVRNILKWELDTAKYDVHIDIKEDSNHVMFDPAQIRQVLHNLIKNSIEAMPSGGILTIHGFRDENGIHLDIMDTGEGIPAELHEQVFEPFYSTKSTGSGLGLPVCQTIMRNHGGNLTLQSAHIGTRIRMTFPESSLEDRI